MRTMKKITSVLLVTVILISALCSCELIGGKDAGELVSEAEAVLSSHPYTIDMVMNYSTDNADMQAVLDIMSKPTVKVEVDGTAFKIAMSYRYAGLRSGVTYTRIGETLYTETNNEGTVSVVSAPYTIAEKLELAEKLGTAANIGIGDFASVKSQSFNGVSVITCTEIKDAPLDMLVSSLEEQLSSIDALVAIKDVNFAIQIIDGRYDTTILSCQYVITTMDNVYTLDMQYVAKFDYDSEVVISAPANE